jgi:hypothetical protein
MKGRSAEPHHGLVGVEVGEEVVGETVGDMDGASVLSVGRGVG